MAFSEARYKATRRVNQQNPIDLGCLADNCLCVNLQSAQKIFGGDVKSHMLLFVSKKADNYDDLIAMYKKAAPAFKGKV